MSNKSEHTKVNGKIGLKLAGGIAVILVAAFIAILIWDIQLPHIRMNPAVKPFTNIVVGVAGLPAFVTYLSWFLWLWLTKKSSYASYRPVLCTVVVLAVTLLLQLVLSFLFGVMGVMAITIAVSTVLLTAASALGFFVLRP